MADLFPQRRSYKNFVPVEAVRRRFFDLDEATPALEARREIAAIRRMALAHALAAEAARAGQWTPEGGMAHPADLSTAAGQLYLRAARQEVQLLKEDPGQPARVLRDRLNAAMEFLAARRQAISAAIVRDLPKPTDIASSPDRRLVELFSSIQTALKRAGRPAVDALQPASGLATQGGNVVDGEPCPEELVHRQTIQFLTDVGRAFDGGGTAAMLDLARRRLPGLEDLVAAHHGGEVADLLGRFGANLEWLVANSVWELPAALNLQGTALGAELVRKLLDDDKAFLFPSQWEGIREHRITSPDQLNVISMPTGSGKSLLAELLLVLHLWTWRSANPGEKKRVFFIVPNRALAREKMQELRELFHALPSIGVSVCQLTGDLLLNADEALRAYDAVVATPEKFDMVLRVPELRPMIGAVVVDEFHNVRDGARGLRLLATLSRLRNNPETRGAALHLVSAIVRPSDLGKVERWLSTDVKPDARRAQSYRATDPPIFTRCGIFDFGSQRKEPRWRVEYDDGTRLEIQAPRPPKDPRPWAWNQHAKAAAALALALLHDGPTMLFATSAKWSWDADRKAMSCPPVESATELASALDQPPNWLDSQAQTRLIDGLARLWGKSHPITQAARRGVVAHWGGLPLRGRRLVERAVTERGAAVLVATSTLAEGVNMPLRRLIIPKCTIRGEVFSTGFFLNLKGRAGRPFLTEEGEVILVASRDTNLELAERLRGVTSEDVEFLESPIHRLAALRSAGTTVEGEEATNMADVDAIEDALDAAILAVICEEEVLEEEASAHLLARTTLDPSGDDGRLVRAVLESVERLRSWSLVTTLDEVLAATTHGKAVYRSGFSPRDAARTRRAVDTDALMPQLFRLLPDSPFDSNAYDAILILIRLLEGTGAWAQLQRAGLRSPEQATMFLLDWVRGHTIEKISIDRGNDRLYLHSMLEGALGPTAAWFLFSLATWLEGDPERSSTGAVVDRLGKWAEFAWFGVPPGQALQLLRKDFQGLWHRDDAIRVGRAFAAEVRDWLSGNTPPSSEDLARRIESEVPTTVEPADRIAAALLGHVQTGAD